MTYKSAVKTCVILIAVGILFAIIIHFIPKNNPRKDYIVKIHDLNGAVLEIYEGYFEVRQHSGDLYVLDYGEKEVKIIVKTGYVSVEEK